MAGGEHGKNLKGELIGVSQSGPSGTAVLPTSFVNF